MFKVNILPFRVTPKNHTAFIYRYLNSVDNSLFYMVSPLTAILYYWVEMLRLHLWNLQELEPVIGEKMGLIDVEMMCGKIRHLKVKHEGAGIWFHLLIRGFTRDNLGRTQSQGHLHL